MQELFQTIIYQPIFNLLVGLYNIIPDMGVVIALITLAIKLVLWPLTSSSIKAQKAMTDLQPKLEELKVTYKDNQQQLAQETMKIYKENKVNPFGSCLPLLIQLPIFLALYWALRAGLSSQNFNLLYPFVQNPGTIKTVTLGLFDLNHASYVLAILAGAAQFWQAKMLMRRKPPKAAGEGGKDESMAAMMNKQMLYMMPALTVIIGFKLPSGLTLYWLISTILTVLQQQILFRKHKDSDVTVIESK